VVVRLVKVVVVVVAMETVIAPVEEDVLVDAREHVAQQPVTDVVELAMEVVLEPVGLNAMDIVIILIIHNENR